MVLWWVSLQCACVRACACVHACVHVHIVGVHVCECACMYRYICVCVQMCMCAAHACNSPVCLCSVHFTSSLLWQKKIKWVTTVNETVLVQVGVHIMTVWKLDTSLPLYLLQDHCSNTLFCDAMQKEVWMGMIWTLSDTIVCCYYWELFFVVLLLRIVYLLHCWWI